MYPNEAIPTLDHMITTELSARLHTHATPYSKKFMISTPEVTNIIIADDDRTVEVCVEVYAMYLKDKASVIHVKFEYDYDFWDDWRDLELTILAKFIAQSFCSSLHSRMKQHILKKER